MPSMAADRTPSFQLQRLANITHTLHQVVAKEVGQSEEEVAAKLQLLRSLLPDLESRLGGLKPADMVRNGITIRIHH